MSTFAERLAAARSFLFVPGDRPDRFDKALATAADIVILDLEDAVPPARKDAARAMVAAWLDGARPVLVRINGAGSVWFEEDLALADRPALAGIMVPKAEPGAALARAAASKPVVALIESAAGVAGVAAIAAVPGVHRLAFGAIDLALDLGMTGGDDLLKPIGLQLVVASRVAGIASPIAGVTADFRDPDAAGAAMRAWRALGFGAKMCIHPAQVATVNAALQPSADEVAQARRILAADAAAGGAATVLDGQMVDRPFVERARRIVDLSDAHPGG